MDLRRRRRYSSVALQVATLHLAALCRFAARKERKVGLILAWHYSCYGRQCAAHWAWSVQENYMKLISTFVSTLLLAVACGGSQEEPKTPAEESVDEAEAEVNEAVEEAGDEMEEAGDSVEDATD